ncbi:MAG: putative TetR-family transcriptional regulator [Actinomycetia bacterium]|jgi:AcrR family transcriptional regulator|nr:putative TetR-family transcriptional regulator [Actinomycetes bacterium]
METLSLAERKRQLVRDELGHAAMVLLAAQGFEATTIDQIVDAAGVSRRTFFRYFKSKEDVILEFLADVGADVCAELAARPPVETPGTALREALTVAVETFTEHPEKSRALARLTLETPALRARYLDRQAGLQQDLAAVIARREGLDLDTDMSPAVSAGMALTAFDIALTRWARQSGAEDLRALIDQAFALAHLT